MDEPEVCFRVGQRGDGEAFSNGGHSGAAPPHSAEDLLGDLRNECFKTLTATPRRVDLTLWHLQRDSLSTALHGGSATDWPGFRRIFGNEEESGRPGNQTFSSSVLLTNTHTLKHPHALCHNYHFEVLCAVGFLCSSFLFPPCVAYSAWLGKCLLTVGS